MDIVRKIVDFLNDIGIETEEGSVPTSSFLPGVRISCGRIIYNSASLRWPGDLLHEAGHIATAPSSLRNGLNDGIALQEPISYATEAEATAWAYAATMHLQLDPSILFHPGGYNGASDQLIQTFVLGVYPGAYGLSLAGLTRLGSESHPSGEAIYPNMLRWLRL